MKNHLRLACALPPVAFLCILAAWLTLPMEQVMVLHEEGAFVENATVVLYFLASALIATQAPHAQDRRTPVALGVLMLLCAARELDFHKRFTDMNSTLRIPFYTQEPWGWAQVLTIAAVVLALGCLGWLAWRHGRGFWPRLRQGEFRAVGAVLFFGTMAIAKFFDRVHAIAMYDFGRPLSESSLVLMRATEEVFEMLLPVQVLVITLGYAAMRAKGRAEGAEVGAG